MSMQELRRNGVKRKPDHCELDPPEWSCCPPCPDPCRPKCCPKTRVWDAIDVFPGEIAHKMEVQRLVDGGERMVAAHRHCIELAIRERGFCDTLVIIEPVRSDMEGNVWFDFPDEFTSAPAGYYEADLRIDDQMCLTLLYHKKGCWTGAVLRDRMFEADCETGCEHCAPNPCCHGVRPSPDLDDTYRSGCDVQCK